MRLAVIAVGRAGRGPEQELVDSYLKRLDWQVRVIEVAEKRKLAARERRAREADKLLAAVPEGAAVIALDETGEALTSRAFAGALDGFCKQSINRIALIIGGADGLDDTVLKRADRIVSLGRMTWPHLLVRAMLAEQIYRAWSIVRSHPYHRD